MKNLIFLFLAMAMTFCWAACGGEGGGTSSPGSGISSDMDSMSYAVGASFSKSVQGAGMNLSGTQVIKGFTECKGGTSFINEDNVRDVTGKLQQAFQQKKAASPEASPAELNLDSLSYAIGCSYYFQLNSLGLEIQEAPLLQGIEDNLSDATSLLDDAQVQDLLQRFSAIAEKAQAEKNAAAAADNLAKGKAFIAEIAKEEGVKSTPSGLHYKVLEAGTGASPKVTDKVSVHYEGTLIDGTIFDSSIKRGQPTQFPLSGVIKGWTEGLQLMKTGAKYRFYIPADLAYGDRGSGNSIGPGETLIFDVELLEIL